MPTGAIEISRVRQALADRYQIEHVLGEGGMATVYQAEDLKHRRKVAVKVMRPELAETLGAERFLREVEIAAKLSHPHILPVYDSGASQGVLYYVMPVIEGESLPARLAREKQLPVEEALRLAREVAEAMAYAHERGFVHRDIKPANILISAGHALVADFGIARAMSTEGKALTQTGLAIGTPQYMSPEQASGATDLDGRSDIYALGCVLYEMIAGEPPFTGPTAQAVISRSITETPRSLTTARSSMSPAVDTAVMRALEKTPADRYANANAMVTALVDAENQSRSGITAAAAAGGGFKTWQLALMGVAVLAVGAIGSRLITGGDGGADTGPKSVAIMPFENLGSEDDAYFADGIVDELRGKLARVSGLTVIASASANQYKGTDKTGPEIAQELRVDNVLLGRVRWAGAAGGPRQVQVVAELVDGETGATTWQETFDGQMTDVFTLQSQLATRVAAALGAEFSRGQVTEIEDTPTDNAVAYDLYLKGRAINNNAAGAQRAAANFFEQAVALDSAFVEAWSWLAISSSLVYTNGTRDPATARRAEEAKDAALQLDPNHRMPHAADRVYNSLVTRDQPAARRANARVLDIDPDNAVALALSGTYDFDDERYAQAFEKYSRARELDPRSTIVLNQLIRSLIYLGRLDEARSVGEELLALDPTDMGAIEWSAGVHLVNGDIERAREAIKEALTRVPPTELVSYLAGYNEMAFVLEDDDAELLFRLTPAAFDNDRAWWGQALSIAAHQRGDMVRARAYADSSLATSKEQSDANPTDPELRALYAVMLAYSGSTDMAITEAERAVASVPENGIQNGNYAITQRIRVYLEAGEHDKALDDIEELVDRQYHVTPGFLKVDPMFRPLDGNPRFDRLLAGTMERPID